MLLQDKNKKA